ncbi:MAG: 50S ribosomal protein L17 [Bacteroidales bacterium]|jgi:large subunit ribosomal protein L17|nr:50S ribosomal protein L17 [Bacteroidales bacterium]MDD2388101.1 50S ribosomal protein L17 [Bacteroidales bacterium]MDD4214297.1 50S ribosomal protein L17 [Bacteroidales bacterium]
MRHNRTINHLGRKAEHRDAMLSNMASSLIKHKRITTTIAKAKALRKYVEPLITKSKEDNVASRRIVFSYLGDKEAVKELFREVSQKIADRPGGYTRILKTGKRLGDQADMCIIELVDYNELMLGEKETKATKTGRRRRGSGKKTIAEKTEKKSPEKQIQEKTKEIVDKKEDEKIDISDKKNEDIIDEVKTAETSENKPESTENNKETETTPPTEEEK